MNDYRFRERNHSGAYKCYCAFYVTGLKCGHVLSNETIRSYFFGGKSVLFCLCYTENMSTIQITAKAEIGCMDFVTVDGYRKIRDTVVKVRVPIIMENSLGYWPPAFPLL